MLRSAQRVGTIEDAEGAAEAAGGKVVATEVAWSVLTTFVAEAAEGKGKGKAPPNAGTAGATAKTFVV